MVLLLNDKSFCCHFNALKNFKSIPQKFGTTYHINMQTLFISSSKLIDWMINQSIDVLRSLNKIKLHQRQRYPQNISKVDFLSMESTLKMHAITLFNINSFILRLQTAKMN